MNRASFLATLVVVILCTTWNGCASSGASQHKRVPGNIHGDPKSPSNDNAASPRSNPEANSKLYVVDRSYLPVQHEQLSVYLPRGLSAPLPSVLLFHSAMGRTQSVLDSCERLAQQGFAAIALDFYQGKVAASPDEARTFRDAANSRSSVLQVMVEQTYQLMESDPRIRSTRRFLLGWSFGGAWATFAGGILPNISGIVAYYGEAFGDNAALYDRLHAPILLIGAQSDSDPAPSRLESIVHRLNSKGVAANLLLLPAAHGFAEQSHPGYNARQCETAWVHVIQFLHDNAQ